MPEESPVTPEGQLASIPPERSPVGEETHPYRHPDPLETSDALPSDIRSYDAVIRSLGIFRWPDDQGLIPAKLGGFQLSGLKAWGGFGGIFKATQVSLNREVAVKVVVAESDEARRLARNEALVFSEVQHGQFLPIFDSGEATTIDGRQLFWFAMRLVPGPSAQRVIKFMKEFPGKDQPASLVNAAEHCVEQGHVTPQ